MTARPPDALTESPEGRLAHLTFLGIAEERIKTAAQAAFGTLEGHLTAKKVTRLVVRDSDGSEHVERFEDEDGPLQQGAAKALLTSANAVPSRNAPGVGALGGLTINIVERVPALAVQPERVQVGSQDLTKDLSQRRIPPTPVGVIPPVERVEITRD